MLPYGYDAGVSGSLVNVVRGLHERHGRKLLRFGAVSAVNVVVTQSLLFGALTVLAWSGVASNIFAVTVSAVPAYLLSRYWVWQKRGRNHVFKEVIPFWSLAVLGLLLSTAAVWYVETNWDPHPLVINVTNLAAFGVIWVTKFLILDRLLFKADAGSDEP